ncbi:putative RNA polymerase II CTD phosphatase Fcp1 [Pyronema omphalodes]|nr:putative RNA polymerase II CTD phosphatase Fcp1 [Pyronema omphalodes]
MWIGYDTYTHFSNTSRATIQLAHDSAGLTEARKLEEQAKRRLLKEKKLSPRHVSGGRGTWYYVKLRPGSKAILGSYFQTLRTPYFTMGTRAYALAVKKIVDPDGKLFGERLTRLFPIDTKMVVIIDDRGDVWKWSENLVKVRPYDFFVGIGDINSMFLPKKQEFPTSIPSGTIPPKALLAVEETKKEEEEGLGKDSADPTKAAAAPQLSALDQLITMGSGDDQQLITEQSTELEKAIEAQKEDRPLAKKQEQQDKMDEKIASLAAATENGTTTPDDSSDAPLRNWTWMLFPDVADIMPRMKRMALSGVVLNADIALWAKNFGAVVSESVTSKVTHLIAARPRTTKVRQATRYPHIKIVNPNWLYDSISNWKHEDEDRYIITIHPEDRHPAGSDGLPSLDDGNGPLLSSEDETGSDEEDEYDSEEGDIKVDVSNVKWGDASNELAEFLGEDADDDDDEDEDEEVEGIVADGADDEEDVSLDGEDGDSATESVRTVEIEGRKKETTYRTFG